MIESRNLVPEVYSKESRDFQLFLKLYDIVFNYIKNNVNLITRDVKDSKLLELMVRTLGFEPKRKYSQDELYSVSKSFSNLMKNKGSIKGIELAVKLSLRTAGKKDYYVETMFDDNENRKVAVIYINDSIGSSEVCLLEELLDYVCPINSLAVIKQATAQKVNEQVITIRNKYKVSSISQKYTAGIAKDNTKLEYKGTVLYGTTGTLDSDPDSPIVGDMRLGIVAKEVKKS